MAFYILALLLLGEGLGILFFHSFLPFILALIPSIFLLYRIIRFNNLHISLTPSGLFLGCSTFLYTLSILNSANKEASIDGIFIYASLFLFYLYFYSYPVKEKLITILMYILCSCFMVAFLLYTAKITIFSWAIPVTEYQLITPFYYPHNHLGDFLGIGIIISFYYLVTASQITYLVPVFLLIPFVLISFSNSAYLSVFLTAILLSILLCKKYPSQVVKTGIILILVFALMSGAFLGSTNISKNNPTVKKMQEFVAKTFSFYPKTLGSNRIAYFSQAIEGIKKNPILGVGPNNFSLFSKQLLTPYNQYSTDVHNLFLEVGVESGVFSLLFLLVFVALRIRQGMRFPTLPFFIFVYLLLNFQTDYTYKIYAVLILFIFTASQIGKSNISNTNTAGNLIFTGTALLIQIVLICLLTSLIFQKLGNPLMATRFNPYNRYAYYDLLIDASKTKNTMLVDRYADKLHTISRYNLQSELEIMDAYRIIPEPRKELIALENAYHIQPVLLIKYIERLYELTAIYRSEDKAKQIIVSYVKERKKDVHFNEVQFRELVKLCETTYEKACEEIKNNY